MEQQEAREPDEVLTPRRPATPGALESVRIMRAKSHELGFHIYGGERPSADAVDLELALHTLAQRALQSRSHHGFR